MLVDVFLTKKLRAISKAVDMKQVDTYTNALTAVQAKNSRLCYHCDLTFVDTTVPDILMSNMGHMSEDDCLKYIKTIYIDKRTDQGGLGSLFTV
jgi:hypothetical protein